MKLSQLTDLKNKSIHKQFYDIAAHARDLERKMVTKIKPQDEIPSEDLKNFNNLILDSRGYYIFKSWMRKLKIKNLYENT